MRAYFFLARCNTSSYFAHVMTTQTANGHGASAVREMTIEWAYGLCEKFTGTFAEAEDKIMKTGLRDDGEVMRKSDGFSESYYERCLQPHGMEWSFVGRIYYPRYSA